MDVFYKIWAWERWFFREKSEKKGIILTFLAHIIVYFDRIDVFDQIWAWQQGVFDENFEKIDIRAQRFWKNGRFFDKIWAWEQCFLENGRFFFENIWALEQIFVVKYRKKKDILFTFLVIMCNFDRIDVFLTKYRYERREFLIKILIKMIWEQFVFVRMDVFLT